MNYSYYRMTDYKHFHVLFWNAVFIPGDQLLYCLMFKGKEEYVTALTANAAMTGAREIKSPIICLN